MTTTKSTNNDNNYGMSKASSPSCPLFSDNTNKPALPKPPKTAGPAAGSLVFRLVPLQPRSSCRRRPSAGAVGRSRSKTSASARFPRPKRWKNDPRLFIVPSLIFQDEPPRTACVFAWDKIRGLYGDGTRLIAVCFPGRCKLFSLLV